MGEVLVLLLVGGGLLVVLGLAMLAGLKKGR